jgi:hypothetical protein
VSLGFARVEGTSAVYRGNNVWGGQNPEAPAEFKGKSYGILAIGTDLYMWRCGDAGAMSGAKAQRLYRSTDNGRSWRYAGWEFPASLGFYCPNFLQFGKGYEGARDEYVYMYAPESRTMTWAYHKPGRIGLMRAPRSQLLNRDAYEFFAGRTETGEAIWTTDVKARQPVIEEANGIRLVSAAYNAGLDRYLITYSFGDESLHNIAILDAPTPWGPYTTAMYDAEWGVGRFTGTCCLMVSFAPKWWLDGGKRFTVVFSGGDGADSWNTVEGTFRVNGTAPAAGTITPVLQASTSSAADPQRTAQKARRQPVKTKRPEPQGTLARSRSSQPDGGEGASTPDGTAPPAPKPRRQIYVSESPPTNLQLPSATDAKPAQQGRGMASAKGEAATALAAGEKRSLAGASPAPPPVPAQNTAEIAGANNTDLGNS